MTALAEMHKRGVTIVDMSGLTCLRKTGSQVDEQLRLSPGRAKRDAEEEEKTTPTKSSAFSLARFLPKFAAFKSSP